MKKILFALCAILMATVHANAQTTTIATLSHEGAITAYYGSNALVQAHEAAADGDVITLSAGMFSSVKISKAITLRGSGCDNDPVTGRQATYLSGNFDVTAPTNADDMIIIEGVYNNNTIYVGDNVKLQLLKSRLSGVDYNGTQGKNAQIAIINCRITYRLRTYGSTSVNCINSIINSPYVYNSNFRNCYLTDVYNMYSSVLNNCVLYYRGVNNVSSSTIVNNCIYGGDHDLLRNTTGGNNTYIEDLGTIFKSWSAPVNDVATYELTDEARSQYLGNDGTQVGIYGGMMPYSTTPGTPQITKFNVAEKSTADGKLSIDITVSMPE